MLKYEWLANYIKYQLAFGDFMGGFRNHQKEPDCALIPRRQDIKYLVFASGQVGPQIAGRLSVRPGQVRVRQTWAL